MTQAEKLIIKAFAGGVSGLRDRAIKIHRTECMRTGSARGTPWMDFMAEVDHPSPDLYLRAQYRARVLEIDLDDELQG